MENVFCPFGGINPNCWSCDYHRHAQCSGNRAVPIGDFMVSCDSKIYKGLKLTELEALLDKKYPHKDPLFIWEYTVNIRKGNFADWYLVATRRVDSWYHENIPRHL